MDSKANILPKICNTHKASFNTYSWPDENNITHADFYNWAESDSNIDTFDSCMWPFMIDKGGSLYFTEYQKECLLTYFQTVADLHNIPFYSTLAIAEYAEYQIESMVLALTRTLKDRNIDIKAQFISQLRSLL